MQNENRGVFSAFETYIDMLIYGEYLTYEANRDLFENTFKANASLLGISYRSEGGAI